jgi:hypothetical protein
VIPLVQVVASSRQSSSQAATLLEKHDLVMGFELSGKADPGQAGPHDRDLGHSFLSFNPQPQGFAAMDSFLYKIVIKTLHEFTALGRRKPAVRESSARFLASLRLNLSQRSAARFAVSP